MFRHVITALFLLIASVHAVFGQNFEIFGIDLNEDKSNTTLKMINKFSKKFGPCGYKEFDGIAYQCPKSEPILPHVTYLEYKSEETGKFYKELRLHCEVYRSCSQSEKAKEMLESRWGIEFEYQSEINLGLKTEEYVYVHEEKLPNGSPKYVYKIRFLPTFSLGGIPIPGQLIIKKITYGKRQEPIFD